MLEFDLGVPLFQEDWLTFMGHESNRTEAFTYIKYRVCNSMSIVLTRHVPNSFELFAYETSSLD
jgi:hypothetical protein